jgi:CheY-like chemotaxis protein
MKTARLLLVDDDCDSLEVLTVLLSDKYDVAGYSSPAEAVTAIEAFRPDLLVLDIGMSPINGVQCLQILRAMPQYRCIPAIALTAYVREVERDAFLSAGFQAIVPKPILSVRDLEAVLEAVVNPQSGRSAKLSEADLG